MEGGVVVEGEDGLRVLEAGEGADLVVVREGGVQEVGGRAGVVRGDVEDGGDGGNNNHCGGAPVRVDEGATKSSGRRYCFCCELIPLRSIRAQNMGPSGLYRMGERG